MTLTERHIITRNDSRFAVIDEAAYKSKNLYNATLYAVRQHYFTNNKYLPYKHIQKQFQDDKQPDYCALPSKVAQWSMKLVEQNFKVYFEALKDYKINPKKYNGIPKPPKYKDKEKGRSLLTYTSQAISKRELDKNGLLKPSGLDITVPTRIKYGDIVCVRIVRKPMCYVVEINHKVPDVPLKDDNGKYAAIDLGVSNFATVTTNIKKDTPFVISGKEIKSYNRYYNKCVAEYKAILDTRNRQKSSNRLELLSFRRMNKVNDFMHKSSRYIVNQLVDKGITTLVIGKNPGWKQDTNIGKVNNQNFVSIPYESFIGKLEYKCRLNGISVVLCEESHTSKCSFLDNEEICHHDKYVGNRVKRGLFRTGTGKYVNADVNGSYNILRKSKPKAFADGVEGVVVHPVIIKITN